jgi:hypothetical protein
LAEARPIFKSAAHHLTIVRTVRHTAQTCLSPQVTGERLVSFLISFMYVYLRPSPSTTAF